MQAQTPKSVTQLLMEWKSGSQESLRELVPLVEGELRRIAHQYMRMERVGHTLQTTALVNEAYLKLVDQARVDWQSRAHFIAVAARVMRQILVDYARRYRADKRRIPSYTLPLEGLLAFTPAKSTALIALEDALEGLAKRDPRKVQVVELRYFGGMSVEEAAEVLGVNPKTLQRDWQFAKVWLKRELSPKRDHAG